MTARLRCVRDERGSMPMLLLVMLVGLTFGALLVPMIITQDQTTRFDISRARSLQAAQAGIEVGLGLVGAAVTPNDPAAPDVSAKGDTTKLPCGPLEGKVGGGSGTYSVRVEYYTADPATSGRDGRPIQKPMTCVPGYGTYQRVDDVDVYIPSYALLTSTGSDGPGVNGASPGRTLQSTYVVRTTNTAATGGVLRIYPDPGDRGSYCMDAGANPVQGSAVSIRECDDTGRARQQVWTYNEDRSIRLASSVTDAARTDQERGNGLCLDSIGPHAVGNTMTLTWCAPRVRVEKALRDRNAPWNQQWNSDNAACLRGTRSDSTDVDGFCVTAALPRALGAPLTLQSAAGGTTNPTQSWVPSPNVGAGAAAPPDPTPAGFLATSHQITNLEQFSRCLDVTSQTVEALYLQSYPCKQNPDRRNITWNQRWAFRSAGTAGGPGRPDEGQWTVNNRDLTDAANTYCMTSTGVAGRYVTVTRCPTDPAARDRATTFTTYLTEGPGGQLPYSDKYTIVDTSPARLCLSLGSPNDLHNLQYSKVVTAVCDGSAEQKWNAVPNERRSTLQNTIELPFTP